MSMTVVELNS